MGAVQLKIVSRSEAETLEIGRGIGSVIADGDAILLYGEMGAGKTCLTRGIAEGAECEVAARSPTFIILGEYPGRVRIFHCDLYRISGAAEAHDLALDETLERGALVVEWPENANGILPKDALQVKLNVGSVEESRTLKLRPNGPTSAELLARIAEQVEAGGLA